MKRKLLFTAMFFMLITLVVNAQWSNQGGWPSTTLLGELHGIAVDPDGKVWASGYDAVKHVPAGQTDSVTSRLIYVFNPDGSQASFSPIWKVTVNGVTDTLKNSTRGMRADHNGNILYVEGGQNMWRFNYQTGEGMNKVALGIGTSPTAPAVSSDGKIFVAPVVNAGLSIQEYDADFNLIGNAVTLPFSGFSRSIECSADGNTLYFPIYTRGFIMIYHRPDELSAFDSVGTLMDGAVCESVTFNKVTGHLWASGGTYFSGYPAPIGWSQNTWYEFDVTNKTVLDSMKWSFTVPNGENERPRGIDFSPNGNTAYLGCFGVNNLFPLVQKVVYTGNAVDPDGQVVVNGYKLSQNYPNPFNPTTKINFELKESGFTSLKIYDMLGNEVATLVNNELTSGSYSINFNAANLASGTYVYQLNVNSTRITNKMILLK